ncbi:hypothetical protein [Paenibacillus dauci]|uniref:hypothetical protein n=1 Tax=Paenibacillus dauci TaxID=1567106 RepID=UPI00061986FE|nr:hypothetical protein [Paenibacillus dauci]
MEFLEVVFDLKTVYLDKLLFKEFNLTEDKIKSSHFYDTNLEQDKEFYEITSCSDFFTKPGTGTVLVKKIQLGTMLTEVLVLISFDEESGIVEINFPESELIEGNRLDKEKCLKLLEYFLSLMEHYDLKSVRFGYEPAADDDTCLIELKPDVTQIKDLVDRL